MSQRVNQKEIKDVYFSSTSSQKSVPANSVPNPSSSHEKGTYQKYSDEQIAQFENFFKSSSTTPTHAQSTADTPSVTPPHPTFKNSAAQVPTFSLPKNEETFFRDESLDDDLLYLDRLVANSNPEPSRHSLASLENLLDEIVDNEKKQISNYETDVFNANVQSLFETDPEADLPPPQTTILASPTTKETDQTKPELPKPPLIPTPVGTATSSVASPATPNLPKPPLIPTPVSTVPNSVVSSATPDLPKPSLIPTPVSTVPNSVMTSATPDLPKPPSVPSPGSTATSSAAKPATPDLPKPPSVPSPVGTETESVMKPTTPDLPKPPSVPSPGSTATESAVKPATPDLPKPPSVPSPGSTVTSSTVKPATPDLPKPPSPDLKAVPTESDTTVKIEDRIDSINPADDAELSEETLKKKKQNQSKIQMLDTILVVLLVIITVILLYYFRDLLPFNLPDIPFLG